MPEHSRTLRPDLGSRIEYLFKQRIYLFIHLFWWSFVLFLYLHLRLFIFIYIYLYLFIFIYIYLFIFIHVSELNWWIVDRSSAQPDAEAEFQSFLEPLPVEVRRRPVRSTGRSSLRRTIIDDGAVAPKRSTSEVNPTPFHIEILNSFPVIDDAIEATFWNLVRRNKAAWIYI